MASPTSRSLDWLRKEGGIAEVVEKWIGNPHVPKLRKRKDLFGFIDVIALDGEPGVLGVQATSKGGMRSRWKKLTEGDPSAKDKAEAAKIAIETRRKIVRFLTAGNRLWIMGWERVAKVNPKTGKTTKRWYPTVMDVQLGSKVNSLLLVKNTVAVIGGSRA